MTMSRNDKICQAKKKPELFPGVEAAIGDDCMIETRHPVCRQNTVLMRKGSQTQKFRLFRRVLASPLVTETANKSHPRAQKVLTILVGVSISEAITASPQQVMTEHGGKV